MRHAKSDWDAGVRTDFERPINTRGKKAAPLMGKFIREQFGKPALIIASPAVRALTTAKMVAKELDYTAEIIEKMELYDSDVLSYVNVAKSISPRVDSALIVGHNFTIEETISALMKSNFRRISMPTAAVVCLDFDIENWSEIRPESAELRWSQLPREL